MGFINKRSWEDYEGPFEEVEAFKIYSQHCINSTKIVTLF